MDKIEILRNRRQKLLEIGKKIRQIISDFTDEKSFVELDAYSFSKNDFYGEDAEGEGVVTGYATVGDSPVFIVAQNVNVLNGGITYANCRKIEKCLSKALAQNVPVVYFLDSRGVSVGEGVNALEGIAKVLSLSSSLKGQVPQYSVVVGKVYGSFALLCANCDYNIMLDGAEICFASPFVVAAVSGKNLPSQKVAGVQANKGLCTVKVSSVKEAKEFFLSANGIAAEDDTDDDLNRASEELNSEDVTPDKLIKAVFDGGKFIPFYGDFCPEVTVGIGKAGGIGVAAVIFGGGPQGVELTADNVTKIKNFAEYASDNGLTLVTFVNTLGIKADLKTAESDVLTKTCELLRQLNFNKRISVVYGKAIGLGYTLFAAKSGGVEYSVAFANAKIALFDGAASSVAFGEVREDKLAYLAEKYSEENADPVNAAKNGYIDDIIEPQFIRPYLISALAAMPF